MSIRITLITISLIAASMVSGAAHAVLQGRDLNGSVDSFEAYYDTDLNITWLADANYARTSGHTRLAFDPYRHVQYTELTYGRMYWDEAKSWVAGLSFTDGINVYDNWRLPTVGPVNGVGFNYTYSTNGSTDVSYNITSPQSEMAHLYYITLGNQGAYTPAGADSGCYVNPVNTCLDNTSPFSNFGDDTPYWSSTEYAPGSGDAWIFSMYTGFQRGFYEYHTSYALAVSPGDVGVVPEAETYALMLAGLAIVGWRARRGVTKILN